MLVREPRRPDETDEQFAKREEAYWQLVMESRGRVLARRAMVANWKNEYQMKTAVPERPRV